MPIKKISALDTSSQQALRTALGWIAMCENFHKSCQGASKDGRPPTRLLYVGSQELEKLNLVELIEGVEWVCLSHRWGNQEPSCSTTTANYADQLKAIEWNKLPRTFQDAVHFTRRLGHEYIWIDSICIIQDDRNDWRHEAVRMADYYGGAALTIAATGAVDCGSGLYNKESVPSMQLVIEGDISGLITVRRKLIHVRDAYSDGRSLAKLPILTRGWIFQERLLSKRILHFSPEELQWECIGNTACDCGFTVSYQDDPKVHHSKALTAFKETGALINRWTNVVEEFSGLQLTHPRDKLPALSGLAKQFSNYFSFMSNPYVYIAGLWQVDAAQVRDKILREIYSEDLIRGMLWARSPNEPLYNRPLPWRCPTWSWASVDGAVEYRWHKALISSRSICFITEIFAQTSPAIPNEPTGEIQGAHLRLRGPMVDATVIYAPSKVDQKGTNLGLDGTKRFSNEFHLHTHVEGGSVEKFFVDYALHNQSDKENYIEDGEQVKVLRMCHIANEPKVLSLVLREVEEGSGMYIRIGIAEELSRRETNAERWENEAEWPLHQGAVRSIICF
jgi:hypothetical protein